MRLWWGSPWHVHLDSGALYHVSIRHWTHKIDANSGGHTIKYDSRVGQVDVPRMGGNDAAGIR